MTYQNYIPKLVHLGQNTLSHSLVVFHRWIAQDKQPSENYVQYTRTVIWNLRPPEQSSEIKYTRRVVLKLCIPEESSENYVYQKSHLKIMYTRTVVWNLRIPE